MTFTPNIPQKTQSLGQTQAYVLGNFANYNSVISVDHVAPNDTYEGTHKQVTLYQYGAASYPPILDKSFMYALNASAAGSQLVYQPTVVPATFTVPVSPRALARIQYTAPSTYVVYGGAYGTATAFNVQAPTAGTLTGFRFNFASSLATNDYFIVASAENTPFPTIFISAKTAAGFTVGLNGSMNINTTFLTFMVF